MVKIFTVHTHAIRKSRLNCFQQIVTVQTRHSQNRACGALRRFATIFAHNLALSTTLYVSAKSCEHDLCAYVQGCLNCYFQRITRYLTNFTVTIS